MRDNKCFILSEVVFILILIGIMSFAIKRMYVIALIFENRDKIETSYERWNYDFITSFNKYLIDYDKNNDHII